MRCIRCASSMELLFGDTLWKCFLCGHSVLLGAREPYWSQPWWRSESEDATH